jgi:hypothetical protein
VGDPLPDRAWYVAYGSNLRYERLMAYLEGSNSGPYGAHPGARDRRPPRQVRSIRFNRDVYFAGDSARWGGPVAFVSLTPGDRTSFGRAYLLEWGQVVDVASQENGEVAALPIGRLPSPMAHVELPTQGKYNALLRLEDLDGTPAVAFTTVRPLRRGMPTPAYAAVIEQGLGEMDEVSRTEIRRYIDRLFG